MPATITWTDSIGAGTLTALGGRFNGWTPLPGLLADTAIRAGSGARDVFEIREIRRVRLTCPFLNTDMATAERLVLHLLRGGTCSLNTADTTTPSPLAYDDMGLAGETEPELSQLTSDTLDYALTATFEYVGSGTPSALPVKY